MDGSSVAEMGTRVLAVVDGKLLASIAIGVVASSVWSRVNIL